VAYKKAFQCKKCPQRNDEEGCPVWWEFMQMNVATGEERLEKMCGFQAMPIFLIEVIKASNRPAAAIESMRNSMMASMNETLPVIVEQQAKLLEINENDD